MNPLVRNDACSIDRAGEARVERTGRKNGPTRTHESTHVYNDTVRHHTTRRKGTQTRDTASGIRLVARVHGLTDTLTGRPTFGNSSTTLRPTPLECNPTARDVRASALFLLPPTFPRARSLPLSLSFASSSGSPSLSPRQRAHRRANAKCTNESRRSLIHACWPPRFANDSIEDSHEHVSSSSTDESPQCVFPLSRALSLSILMV